MSQTRPSHDNDEEAFASPSLRPVPTNSIVRFPSLPALPQDIRRTTTQPLPRWSRSPPFSLAGGNIPTRARDNSEAYVDPEYAIFAAPADWPKDAPVWGLAKPLPRVVRPGMRRRATSHDDTDAVESEQNGDVEATPQVNETPGIEEVLDQERRGRRSGERSRASASVRFSRHGRDQETSPRVQSERILSPVSHRSRGGASARPAENELAIPPPIPEGQEYQQEDREKPEATIQEENRPEFLNKWSEIRHQLREPLAEGLGTAIAMTIGFCGSFSVTTSQDTAGNFQSGNGSWGLGIMIGIYVSGGISGAHLNPAISIMLSIFRGFPWRRCGIYSACQFLGALAAAGIAFGLYRDAILHLDGHFIPDSTGVSFYTSPKAWVSPTTAFFNELVASAILGCAILALGDDSNAPPGAGMHAFIIGLLITVLSMCFSYNTGACLNPVRDLAPRLVALMAGYGDGVFEEYNYWWIWGPFAADITGVLLGAFMYDALVFVGGESPVNYPARRRRRARMKFAARWSRRIGRRESKVKKYEKGVEDNA